MTRARNRRRRVPLHPATTGTFQPLKDPAVVNGADCKSNESVEKGDYSADNHHSQHTANAGDQRLEEPQVSKREGNGWRSQDHNSTTCPHHHHHHHRHHHQHPNQKREGKECSDLRRTLASSMAKHQGEDGKASHKPQEYTPYMAARAKELKEEGNWRFQQKEYVNAMDHYELALKLTPPDHPDRAIFHSNRAACLMQMKPVQYDAAIRECNLALHAHPGFPRALLRRARAFEAIGKLDLALQDIEILLQGDVGYPDAIDMAKRIRLSMENQGDEAQQDDQGTPSTPVAPPDVKTCAGTATDVSGESKELHSVARSVCKERRELNTMLSYDEDDHGAVLTPCPLRHVQTPTCPSSQQLRTEPSVPLSTYEVSPNNTPSDFSDSSKPLPQTPPSDSGKAESLKKVIHQDSIQILQIDSTKNPNMRPLKLIYDHDIRLGEMPVNCTFGDLRKLVRERFPSSKAILIKYKDAEGDLVTITSTQDLRRAEAAAAIEAASRSFQIASMDGLSQDQQTKSAIGLPVVASTLDQLRLHVVEVPGDQEPYDKEEINGEASALAKDGARKTETVDSKVTAAEGEAKTKGKEDFDKWLLDFAELFRSHLGIDPNGHIDLHDRGMELCAEALEESVSTEEAHKLLELAASKFQEMVALGFLNWGNAYMCAARKQLPHDSDDDQLDFCDRLQAAFDWAQAQYAFAEEKFGQSLHVKPDFCDAMLSLGQKDFESAKLHWSLTIAKQTDLSMWDSSEMLKLFCKAEYTMQEAAEMLEKREGGFTKDAKTSAVVEAKTEDVGSLQGSSDVDQKSSSSTSEQDVALKSQVYLFWGNILYEHSQVEFRLGLPSWIELLDAAVQKFEVAGASSLDITTALQNHLSSSTVFVDAMESRAQQQGSGPKGEGTDESEENASIAQQQGASANGEKMEEIEDNTSSSDQQQGSAAQDEMVEIEEEARSTDQQQGSSPLDEKIVEIEAAAMNFSSIDHLDEDNDNDDNEKSVSKDATEDITEHGQ